MSNQRHNEPMMQVVAKRLSEIRKAANRSQNKVYKDTKIHVGRIESGYANITLGTLSDLCKYYNISFEELFDKNEFK